MRNKNRRINSDELTFLVPFLILFHLLDYPIPTKVWVVDPEGAALGCIRMPGFCSTVTFGDQDGKALYIATEQGISRLRMRVSGGRWRSDAASRRR